MSRGCAIHLQRAGGTDDPPHGIKQALRGFGDHLQGAVRAECFHLHAGEQEPPARLRLGFIPFEQRFRLGFVRGG